MAQHSLFANRGRHVCVDTSVLINLDSSGFGAQLLRSFDGRIVIARGVELELCASGARGRALLGELKVWAADNLIRIVEMDEEGESLFETLISGSSAQTLDDGESATIVCAHQLQGIAVIDDRKAGRICKERFPAVPVASSVDVFRHAQTTRSLSADQLREAVYNALHHARMSVSHADLSWVTELLGADRADHCTSLPAAARRSGAATTVRSMA